ncbi:hypothetical protein [Propionicimonas sp.]|uniref:hypothetical protein n=1 Tax=Propionicimonas sp. TaxID=1955623 RepID=UPI0039E39F78
MGRIDAGITTGSTITRIAGEAVDTYAQVTAILGKLSPGDVVKVGWTDADGTARTAAVRLGRAPVA